MKNIKIVSFILFISFFFGSSALAEKYPTDISGQSTVTVSVKDKADNENTKDNGINSIVVDKSNKGKPTFGLFPQTGEYRDTFFMFYGLLFIVLCYLMYRYQKMQTEYVDINLQKRVG